MPCRPFRVPASVASRMFRRGNASSPTPTPSPPPSGWNISLASAETQSIYADKVTTPFADKWEGVDGTGLALEVTVNDNTAFANAYAAAKAACASNPGIRRGIRAGPGVTSMFMGEADFFPHLGGGLIVRPTEEFLQITGLVVNNAAGVPRGLQLGIVGEGFHFCSTTAGGNGQIRFNQMVGSNRTIARIQGNRFGLQWDSLGYGPDSAVLGPSAGPAGSCIRAFDGEDIQVTDNVFRGYDNGVDMFSVRLAEVARNDFQQGKGDDIGCSAFFGGKEFKGVYADDHQYVWAHGNTSRNILDFYDYSPASLGPHKDFLQLRTSASYPGSLKDIVLGSWKAVNGNYYLCVQAGKTGTNTPPIGTANGQVDGTVIWDYICPVASGPGCFITIEDNHMMAAAQAYGDDGGIRYGQTIAIMTDSDGGQRHGVLCLNTTEGTRSSYGIQAGGTGLEYARAEHSAVGPPSELMPQGGSQAVMNNQKIWVFYGGTDESLYYTDNCVSTGNDMDNGSNTINNVTINPAGSSGRFDPGTVLNGSFHQQDGYWLLDYNDTGEDTPAAFRQAMIEAFTPSSGSEAGPVL